MKKACLAIGVGDAPPLDYLRGAINGAHSLAEWTQKQSYHTLLLTDEQNSVEFDDVKTALTGLLSSAPERLLIYFAGHGMSLPMAVAHDLWLLSRWDQSRRGVSVNVMSARLRRYGIRQLVIISDACRTLPNAGTSDVTGDPVLDRGPYEATEPQKDTWFAASEFRAAWMIPGRTPAESRCIFSGLLLESLNGVHEEAFDGQDATRGITSYSLASFLEARVPELASRYGATLTPVINTGVRPPNHIYVPGGLAQSSVIEQIPWPDPGNVEIAGMSGVEGHSRVKPPRGQSWSTPEDFLDEIGERTRGAVAPAVPQPNLAAIIADDVAAITRNAATAHAREAEVVGGFGNELRPDQFEAGTGFIVSGAKAKLGLLGLAAKAQREPDRNWWRIIPSDSGARTPWWSDGGSIGQPLPVLVELVDRRWVGAAVLPGFILSFTLNDAGALAVIYRSVDMPHAPYTEAAMAQLLAGALSREQAPDIVQQLRAAKHADPMLGVLAAYLHDAMGDLANIHRMAYFFAKQGEPIPFDIALLGHLPARRDADGLVHLSIPAVPASEGGRNLPGYMKNSTPAAEGTLAGAFPWLRQGWALLDPDGIPGLYPAGLADIGAYLQPAPFTTLEALGGVRLAQLLFDKE